MTKKTKGAGFDTDRKLWEVDIEFGDVRRTMYVVASIKSIAEMDARSEIVGSIKINETKLVKSGVSIVSRF